MHQVVELFETRLDTLSSLLDTASEHFDEKDNFLDLRLVEDMLPLGIQVVFTCNQPHNFATWLRGEEVKDLPPTFTTVEASKELIHQTKSLLRAVDLESPALGKNKVLHFPPDLTAELSAVEYVHDFLIPNFYFHLVTAYDILRANGVPIGKANYMRHMAKYIKSGS